MSETPTTPSPLRGVHEAAGARLGDWEGREIPVIYSDPSADLAALRGGAGLVDLTGAGVLRLEGPDTRRFANAMFTNNVRDLPVGAGVHNALTDNKGRVQGLAETWLVAEDQLLVLLEGLEAQEGFDRLDRFIIMDPVELTDLTPELGVLTLQGPQAAAVLLAAGAPGGERAERWGDRWVLPNPRVPGGGVDLLVPREVLAQTWDTLVQAGARPAGVRALDALRVAQGWPRWPVDMGERAFLHELGLRDRVCSFTKGCYIGQEVINRMDTMGKINRRLVALEAAAPGIAGAEALLEGKVVGQVGGEATLDGRVLALAMIRKEAWEPGTPLTLRVGEREVAARVVALPA